MYPCLGGTAEHRRVGHREGTYIAWLREEAPWDIYIERSTSYCRRHTVRHPTLWDIRATEGTTILKEPLRPVAAITLVAGPCAPPSVAAMGLVLPWVYQNVTRFFASVTATSRPTLALYNYTTLTVHGANEQTALLFKETSHIPTR